MREMHKWKDKVELSLDNRQIFFLFFGLSAVGCLVFALGVMVGRRVDFESMGEVEAPPKDGLVLLDRMEPEPTSYRQQLGLPPARSDEPGDEPAPASGTEAEGIAAPTEAEGVAAPTKAAAGPPAPGSSAGKPTGEKSKPAPSGPVLAAAEPTAPTGPRHFTLQMKAFSKVEEAEAFAAPLRANGHDVRIEPHESGGRIWHRVRLGEFESWDEGLKAKAEFEKGEKLIAYVVRI